MIKRLLVANRGEIAVRIMATAAVLGIETVAVYPADDAACGHVGRADAAVRLPGRVRRPTSTWTRSSPRPPRPAATCCIPATASCSNGPNWPFRCAAADCACRTGPDALALFATGRGPARARELGVPVLAGTGVEPRRGRCSRCCASTAR